MRRELYVMVDSVSGNFGEPFTMANHAELRRQFEQIAANPALPAYALRDTLVVYLGALSADIENPCIIPAAVPTVILRGESYNYEKIRKCDSEMDAATSILPAGEGCETS